MSAVPTPPNWQTLVSSISDGEAVLVLGPNAIPYYQGAEESFFSKLSRTQVLREVQDPSKGYPLRFNSLFYPIPGSRHSDKYADISVTTVLMAKKRFVRPAGKHTS